MALQNHSVTIVKLGGSIITHKDRYFSINSNNILESSRQLSRYLVEKEVWEKIVIIHGGGSFSHLVASSYTSDSSGFSSEEFGSVLVGIAARELDSKVLKMFLDYGIRVFPLQPSSFIVRKNDETVLESWELLRGILEDDWVPVLYGDTIFNVTSRKWEVLSGEGIIGTLCSRLPVGRILIATNTNGVLRTLQDQNSQIPTIKAGKVEEIRQFLGGSKDTDVTGGMYSKVVAMANEVIKHGVKVTIFDGTKEMNLYNALKGDDTLGTRIER